MDSAVTNPLWGVETGSIVYAETGRFGAPVLTGHITKVVKQGATSLSMSGNSSYAYTDHMNQGSFTMSGSYGVSGVSKVSGAVSAYVGNTGSETGKTLSITLSCTKAAGIEYIDFDSLSMADFQASLLKNVAADSEEALTAFLAYRDAGEIQKRAADEAAKSPLDDAKKQAAHAATTHTEKCLASWLAAANAFTVAHGTGIVIGTLWGGYGTVELTFTSDAKTDTWAYGGSGEFSYAGTGAAANVSAAYGGSTQSLGENARASVLGYANGTCVEELVNAWFAHLQDLADKGLDELGKASVSPPSLETKLPTPTPPEFVEPQPEKSVADRIGEISNLESLETYAKAAAYDKYKQQGGTKDLKEFLDEAATQNESAKNIPVPSGSAASNDNRPSSLTALIVEPPEQGFSVLGRSGLSADGLLSEGEDTGSGGDSPFANYTPLGVWIVNWSQLFPWLVSGHSNEVPPKSKAHEMVALRTMQQDFITLARLYQRFARAPFTLKVPPMTEETTFASLADEFAQGASRVAKFMADAIASEADDVDAGKEMADRLRVLSAHARTIFDTWNDLGFLRGAELGLGIILKAPHLKAYDPHSFRGYKDTEGQAAQKPSLTPCNFNGMNHSVFSDFVKGWPLIFRDKEGNGRVVCYVEGPKGANCGILAQDQKYAKDNYNFFVWKDVNLSFPNPGDGRPGRFPVFFEGAESEDGSGGQHLWARFNQTNLSADADQSTVRLWPIPFEAADGVQQWKGQSMATGDGGLGEKLKDVAEGLAKLSRWSFDSTGWVGRSLDGRYRLQTLAPSYIGLVPEAGNVFARTQ